MRIVLTPLQIETVVKDTVNQRLTVDEQDASTDPSSQQPQSGTSSQQSGGQGYPQVSKWESGVQRGSGNQLGVTKWSDIVGSQLKRDKANQLKEQDDWWNRPSYEKREWEKSTKTLENLNPHTLLQVAALGTAFIPVIGPILTLGLGAADAYLYYKEGDEKTAGLVLMFSLLPGIGSVVNKIPGVKQLGSKGMVELAKKITLGKKITNPTEVAIVNNIAKYRQLIDSEMKKIGKEATIKLGKQSARKTLEKQSIKKGLGSTAKTVASYGAAGYGYGKTYDYLKNSPYNPEDLELVDGIWVPKQNK